MPKIFYQQWNIPVYVDSRASLDFTPHIHDNIEIVFMLEGQTELSYDSTTYTVNPGEAAVIFPNHSHGFVNSKNCNAFILIAKSAVLSAFGKNYCELNPSCPIVRPDSETFLRIKDMFNLALSTSKSNHVYKNEKLNAATLLICAELLPHIEFSKSSSKARPMIEADIFSYCNRNFDGDISLDGASKALSISKYHIMRIFRERFNTTFQNYINGLRIDKAKNLLIITNCSVTDISILCGYNTIRSFNRIFLQFTGMSPSDFRKANR